MLFDQDVQVQIGCQARLTPKESLEALDAAVAAWGNGAGEWPQMSLSSRIACMEKFVELLKPQREIIVKVLMWEICKVSGRWMCLFEW